MNRITLPAPAKINLALKVINKRPDGYHNLKTLFERVNLCDEITFVANKSGKIKITCRNPQVPRGSKNLIYRAARLLQEEYAIPQGVDVQLTKRIPVAAGLAGGSSNAATALLGLNKIWNLGLKRKKLLKIAMKIGADVPFFIHNCSWALGTQRGDHIKKLSISVKLWHILIVPRIKMYSSEVFTAINLKLTKGCDNVNILIRSLKNDNIKRAECLLSNDLEKGILRLRPSLINIKKILNKYNIKGVSFSGSGPSMFGLVDSRREAQAIKAILGKRYSRIFIVRTL